MKSDKLILTQNYAEIKEAEKLGIQPPAENKIHTKILFYKRDVKRVMVSTEGTLVLEFQDGDLHELEYSEKMWKELERYVREHDDDDNE